MVVVAGSATAAGPGTLRRQVGSLESQRRAAVLDLYALESHAAAAQERLTSLQRQADSLRAQQLALRTQLRATRSTLAASQRQLALNLQSLYKQGDVNTLAVVLGAQSLEDAVTQLDALNRVADENEQVASATTRAERRLVVLRVDLGRRQARLAAAVADVRQTISDLIAARAAKESFVAGLRRREQLKTAQIHALEARAARAQQKSAALTAAASDAPAPTTTNPADTASVPDPAPSPAPPASGRAITVSSTGYSLPGHTATGLPVGWGVVAVDPTVIPLGTKLYIPGYGDAVAADVGSGVRGNDIDLWFPSLAQARAWGRRTITITLH